MEVAGRIFPFLVLIHSILVRYAIDEFQAIWHRIWEEYKCRLL